MKKTYTQQQYDIIHGQIAGCRTVAGYLVDNLEKIPFADLRERLENLRDLVDLAKDTFEKSATDEQ